MKISIRKIFLLLAIVISLVAVQVSWAHLQSVEGPYTVDGTVAYVWGDRLAIACGYTIEPDPVAGCPLMVSGMGPAGWWSVNEVTFPSTGSEVRISIYKVITDVGDTRYVAGEVLDNGEGERILLHIPIYEDDVIYVLDSVWSKMEPLAEATILSTNEISDIDYKCICKCTNGDTCDCICDFENCEDCVPVGDENKWKGAK